MSITRTEALTLLGAGTQPGPLAFARLINELFDRIEALEAANGGRVFSPHHLYQSGDILLWYDPSDLSTMFKDTAGTQPVTADGDSVALMLDKGQWGGKTLEQVLAEQPELAPNSGTSLSGWTVTVTAGSVTTDGTGIRIQFPGAGTGFAGVLLAPGASKTYRVEATIVVASGTLTLQIGTAVRNFTSGTYTLSQTIGNTVSLDAIEFKRINVSTAVDVTISAISIKEIPGYHRTQATGTSMPKHKTDGALHWLLYDGTDDGYATGTITWGTDEVAVCTGITKSSDAAAGVVAELSATSASNNGTFALLAPSSAAANYFWRTKGTAASDQTRTTYAAPTTDVLTGMGKIATDSNRFRIDSDEATAATDQGTGNFGSYVIYFGRRGGASNPFNGREYQTVIRSRLLSPAELSSLETFIAAKTGVTL